MTHNLSNFQLGLLIQPLQESSDYKKTLQKFFIEADIHSIDAKTIVIWKWNWMVAAPFFPTLEAPLSAAF